MAFISIHADLSRTASALERIADLLSRLVPPPLPDSGILPRRATLSDLRRTDSDSLAPILSALETAAGVRGLSWNEPEFVSQMVQFEILVRDVSGEDAIDGLPWNKAAGRRIFERYHHAKAADRAGVT